MFCSNCGKPASGKFCSYCGAPLTQPPSGDATPPPVFPPPPAIDVPPPPAPTDWSNEIDYETLLKIPEVKDILARQIPPPKTLSGEDFAEAGSKLVKTPVPVVPLMTITHDLYQRLGIKTGKAREQTFPRPAGKVLVAILCSLARTGNSVRSVQQASTGCLLVCDIPSSLFSMEGDLLITVTREPAATTKVSAATRIGGQLYDWGVSNRLLDKLFSDITAGY